jgi:hypothetical protein
MKRYVLKIAAFALVLGSTDTAIADTVTGTINWVNPYGQQMLVDGYHWFILAPGTNTAAVQVGNTVNLTFTQRNGEDVVTKVSPAGQLVKNPS